MQGRTNSVALLSRGRVVFRNRRGSLRGLGRGHAVFRTRRGILHGVGVRRRRLFGVGEADETVDGLVFFFGVTQAGSSARAVSAARSLGCRRSFWA